MDQQTFMDIATVVSKLRMYPYFDIAGYILMCLIVREDNHPQATGNPMCIIRSALNARYALHAVYHVRLNSSVLLMCIFQQARDVGPMFV